MAQPAKTAAAVPNNTKLAIFIGVLPNAGSYYHVLRLALAHVEVRAGTIAVQVQHFQENGRKAGAGARYKRTYEHLLIAAIRPRIASRFQNIDSRGGAICRWW